MRDVYRKGPREWSEVQQDATKADGNKKVPERDDSLSLPTQTLNRATFLGWFLMINDPTDLGIDKAAWKMLIYFQSLPHSHDEDAKDSFSLKAHVEKER